jgi:uncharacterized damage-inducible protein DinB
MSSFIPDRPEEGEFAAYYLTYIARIPAGDIRAILATQIEQTEALLKGLPEPEAERHHGSYTWSIKDVLAHLIDAERIFGVRALCFARHDPNPLPGFDENSYAIEAHADARPLADLLQEFAGVRQSTLHFLSGLPPSAWVRGGTANGNFVTVRALAYIIAGHEQHHIGIARQRIGAS